MIKIKTIDQEIQLEVLLTSKFGTERLLRVDIDLERKEVNASATGSLSAIQAKEFIRAIEIGCSLIDNEIKVE